jgi:peptide deformylase
MPLRPVVTVPDARLRTVAVPVGAADDAVRRLFGMDAGWKDGAPEPIVCATPENPDPSPDTATRIEGCRSIPDHPVAVARPAAVTLPCTGRDGARHERRLTGFAARVAQVEADHRDGRLFFDRQSRVRRDVPLRKAATRMR